MFTYTSVSLVPGQECTHIWALILHYTLAHGHCLSKLSGEELCNLVTVPGPNGITDGLGMTISPDGAGDRKKATTTLRSGTCGDFLPGEIEVCQEEDQDT